MPLPSRDPTYGKSPEFVGFFPKMNLTEVMYYLYLPVRMENSLLRLPRNLEGTWPLVCAAENFVKQKGGSRYKYTYISARKGWATPDNPLNRPGWHCDGFGTEDINFVWWKGPGTRFSVQAFTNISSDHNLSILQFEEQVRSWITPMERCLYAIDPFVVHATPKINPPGCWRQYIKISLSDQRYNLQDNSHNYLFDYNWDMFSRESTRNDPHRSQRDYF